MSEIRTWFSAAGLDWRHNSALMGDVTGETTEEVRIETFHISNPATSHYWSVALRP